MSSACICHIDPINCFYCQSEVYKRALSEIDTHIRADENPVPYIIETLKNTLPEYKER